MKRRHRLFAILMAMALVLTYMPAMAFAEDGSGWDLSPVSTFAFNSETSMVFDAWSEIYPEDIYADELDPSLSFEYKWYKDTAAAGVVDPVWSEMAGETSAQITVPCDEKDYRCDVTEVTKGITKSIIFSTYYYFADCDGTGETINVNGTKSLSFAPGNAKTRTFVFTPSKSGEYAFFSSSQANVDTNGRILTYDPEYDYYETIDSDYASGQGENFYMVFNAEAGKTYYLQAQPFYNPTGTVSFSVSLIEETIASIGYTPAAPIELVEGQDGGPTSEGVFIYSYSERNGDRLIINYKDGTSETYVYNDTTGYFVCGSKSIEGLDVWFDDDQSDDNHWMPGNNHSFTVNYRGKTCSLPISIISAAEAKAREDAKKAAEAKAKAEAEAKAKAEAEAKARAEAEAKARAEAEAKAKAEAEAKAKAEAEAKAKAEAEAAKTAAGTTHKVGGSTYKVISPSALTVAFTKAKNAKSVTIPATVTLNGKTFKVTQINASAFKGKKIKNVTIGKNVKTIKKNAFKGSKATTLTVKTTKLTKKTIKGCLKGSKIKTVKVKVGSKSKNKTYVKKYKKIFTKKIAGKKAKVK